MSAAALQRRTSTASKLKDSQRQLRRYLSGDSFSERILLQKCEKVNLDREELISNHHLYAEKAGIDLEDDDLKNFLESKIDEAVDIVDEATLLIEQLGKDAIKEVEEKSGALNTQKKEIELISAKLETETNEALIEEALEKINAILVKEDHSDADMITVRTLLEEIQSREEELVKSWNLVKSMSTTEEEIKQINNAVLKINAMILGVRTKGKLVISKGKVKVENAVVEKLPSDNHMRMQLQKMKPPTFSGNIREFARFKADFQSIVIPSYAEPIYQVYVLK